MGSIQGKGRVQLWSFGGRWIAAAVRFVDFSPSAFRPERRIESPYGKIFL